MVLNKFAFLTRQGLGKTLTHVPQTFVAGTQSSYASSSTPFAPFGNHAPGKFGKAGNAHLHTAFQSPSGPNAAQNKAASGSGNGDKNDGGLAAYYDAWQKQHQPGAEDKEWKQFQFTKRIGWKPPTAAVLAGRAKEREEQALRPDHRLGPVSLNRAYSASAIDDIKKSDNALAEAEALSNVNEAIAEEIGQMHVSRQNADLAQLQAGSQTSMSKKTRVPTNISQQIFLVHTEPDTNSTHQDKEQHALHLYPDTIRISSRQNNRVNPPHTLADETDLMHTHQDQQQTGAEVLKAVEMASPQARSIRPSSVQSGSTGNLPSSSGLLGTETATTPEQVVDEAFSFNSHISKLRSAQEYAQIPAVFQEMLAKELQPTIESYNALLSAVVNTPMPKHHVVPRALDVYTNMLQQKVAPDTAFYTTLLQLLACRALDVSATKQQMEQQRERHGFLLPSKATELDILADDNAHTDAIKIFDSSLLAKQNRIYSSKTYRLLITAFAKHGKTDEMIRTLKHMEEHSVLPMAVMFPYMIEAFGRAGDLRSAVDSCYDMYKGLAIADDHGNLVIQGREDAKVHAAVVKALVHCDKAANAWRFFGRVLGVYEKNISIEQDEREVEVAKDQLAAVQDSMVVDAFVQEFVDSGNPSAALAVVEDRKLTSSARNKALTTIAVAAADKHDTEACLTAYHEVPEEYKGKMNATMAILHMWLRAGQVDEARRIWDTILSRPILDGSFVGTIAHYATVLIQHGFLDEGLMQARNAFAQIRASTGNHPEIVDEIDEAIEFIGSHLLKHNAIPSGPASIGFLQAMVENNGLVTPLAEQLLAVISAHHVDSLRVEDKIFLLRAQAEILAQGDHVFDGAHVDRLAYLVDVIVTSGTQVDQPTYELVAKVISKISPRQPELLAKWRSLQLASAVKRTHPFVPFTPQPSTPLVTNEEFVGYNDRYNAKLDALGSNRVAQALDKAFPGPHKALESALEQFRDTRRLGRHPRFDTYAKLINAAARLGRANTIQEIYAVARKDVPLMPGHTISCHGWFQILDAMVGACLTTGNRTLAEQYHQELLEIGYAPTANTFGLYITTMTQSGKPLDEATEAVKVFHRAQKEGVLLTSFLYNTVIGKLARARRIEDTLRFYSEMCDLNIRATSVTYGSVISALLRVSNEKLATTLFNEMESQYDYKPRPAPYNSMMQFYLTTKRDSSYVFAYFNRMQLQRIAPTSHTYKLLIETHATLDPVNFAAAQGVLGNMRRAGIEPEALHYAALIQGRGCALHDMAGARQIFDQVFANGRTRPQACLYQALIEAMTANHHTTAEGLDEILQHMAANGIQVTPYIANPILKGWGTTQNLSMAESVYNSLGQEKREPSTYEEMIKAYLRCDMRQKAVDVVNEFLSRGYPEQVCRKVQDLLGLADNPLPLSSSPQ